MSSLCSVMDPAAALELSVLSRYRVIDETIARGDSDVQQFYSDAVVFITGGSGFLGKSLVEKLFRSCRIKKLYMLLRDKKGKTIQERFAKIFLDPLYDKLRQSQPDFMDKIIPVQGDITELRMGISDEEWDAMTSEVDVIFHSAATINFVETLKVATLTNVRGTREALIFGQACQKLRSFVHISTAFSHATSDRFNHPVFEKFYRTPLPPDTIIKLAEHLDEKQLHDMTPMMIKVWPNTYSYTKAIGEELVRSMAGSMPICIVRPAIVICSHDEPSPGWVDTSCALGPSGFVLGIGLGVLHVVKTDPEVKVDLIPVDLVNNAVIIAGREAAKRVDENSEIKIYTLTGNRNVLTFGTINKLMHRSGRHYSTDKCVWYTYGAPVKNKLIGTLLTWLLHYIPGGVVDLLLIVVGRKPLMINLYSKVSKLNDVFLYYMTHNWEFSDSNLMNLYRNLSPADKIIYKCDMSIVNWQEYFFIWCIGLRKYIIKDGLTGTAKGVRKQYWFKYAHIIATILYIYVLWKLFRFFYSTLRLVI